MTASAKPSAQSLLQIRRSGGKSSSVKLDASIDQRVHEPPLDLVPLKECYVWVAEGNGGRRTTATESRQFAERRLEADYSEQFWKQSSLLKHK
jgi:hypothetical protein